VESFFWFLREIQAAFGRFDHDSAVLDRIHCLLIGWFKRWVCGCRVVGDGSAKWLKNCGYTNDLTNGSLQRWTNDDDG